MHTCRATFITKINVYYILKWLIPDTRVLACSYRYVIIILLLLSLLFFLREHSSTHTHLPAHSAE